jgi:hypothetical protein
MRTSMVLLALVPVSLVAGPAMACPEGIATDVSTDEQPSTISPCMRDVDFSHSQRSFEVGYAVGAGGTSQTGVGSVASVFAGLDLAYGVQFGSDEAQPSYEVELTAGVTGQRAGGDVEATGVVTRAGARIGPAQMAASLLDEGKGNIAFFPFTMEIAHTGELAARPRLSARPEMARSLYGRERVEIVTRIVRIEGAGEKPTKAGAPGETKPMSPSAWSIDVLPLHAGLDVALQSGARIETTSGGYMLGAEERMRGMSFNFFGIEHRRIDLPMYATDLDTVWMLRVNGVDPYTGSQYYIGWGEVLTMPGREELGAKLDPENGSVSIGGLGWFSKRREWGGFGAQYKREPFVTMTGDVALEDRLTAEVYVPSALNLVASAFAAWTTRLVDGELKHESTAGVELGASYAQDGFTSKVGLEVGRTYYTALDDVMPMSAGFAAVLGLTVQHTGRRAWMR